MVIHHNILSENTGRQLHINQQKLQKSTEKLSSGYRINRSADDAAGLAISEKMRSQIRGLTQADENIQDGISFCQVADGALEETSALLQRIRELSVQAANGTNGQEDRDAIHLEVGQLKQEIDRIAQTTSFNRSHFPLNDPAVLSDQITETPSVPGTPGGGGSAANIFIKEATHTFVTSNTFIYEGKQYQPGDTVTITGMTTNGGEIRFDGGMLTYDINGNFDFIDHGAPISFAVRKSDLLIDTNGAVYFKSKADGSKWYFAYKEDGSADPIASGTESDIMDIVTNGGYQFFTAKNLTWEIGNSTPAPPDNRIRVNYNKAQIQAGATPDRANRIPLPFVNATCKGLGIKDLSVKTQTSCQTAIALADTAIFRASTYRSHFGVTQNRLEHAYRVNENTAENTTRAESQIRDTDMASEMVAYAGFQILSQTGQSMLAQANQSKDVILSLLQ